MKEFKKIVVLFMAICLICSLAACIGSNDEYASVREFEFHFYPEEYEEEYRETSKTLPLDVDTDYQLQLDATSKSGTIEISVTYTGADEKAYIINTDTPCHELLTIPANTTSEVIITISIGQDTNGDVIGELMAHTK